MGNAQDIIALTIVCLAVLFLVRRILHSIRGYRMGRCGGGCAGCHLREESCLKDGGVARGQASRE